MNVHGHLEVAARSGLGAEGGLGAVLPDLAAMLRTRLAHTEMPPAVRDGVALHHRTDAVFHDHPQVRASMARITAALDRGGIARGAARAIGHVGYELLLDAEVDRTRLAGTLAVVDATMVQRVLGAHPQWPELHEHLASGEARHHDPDWVAERLFHILRRRPRLAFPAGQVDTVAAVLTEHAPTIRATAPQVVDDVTTLVARSGERFTRSSV